MSGPTSKSAWTGMERWVAQAWSIIFGIPTTRTPLSGFNSRHGPGDCIVPPQLNLGLVIESKYRSGFMHHTLFANVVKDCVKNKTVAEHAVLYTKVKRALNDDTLVVLRATMFHKLMMLPGALDLFRREQQGK